MLVQREVRQVDALPAANSAVVVVVPVMTVVACRRTLRHKVSALQSALDGRCTLQSPSTAAASRAAHCRGDRIGGNLIHGENRAKQCAE